MTRTAFDAYLAAAEATVVAVLTDDPAAARTAAQDALNAYGAAVAERAGELTAAAEGGRLLEALSLVDPDDRPRP